MSKVSKSKSKSNKSDLEKAGASKLKDKGEVEVRKHVTELPVSSRNEKLQSSERDDELEDLKSIQKLQMAKFKQLVTHQIEFETENFE